MAVSCLGHANVPCSEIARGQLLVPCATCAKDRVATAGSRPSQGQCTLDDVVGEPTSMTADTLDGVGHRVELPASFGVGSMPREPVIGMALRRATRLALRSPVPNSSAAMARCVTRSNSARDLGRASGRVSGQSMHQVLLMSKCSSVRGRAVHTRPIDLAKGSKTTVAGAGRHLR